MTYPPPHHPPPPSHGPPPGYGPPPSHGPPPGYGPPPPRRSNTGLIAGVVVGTIAALSLLVALMSGDDDDDDETELTGSGETTATGPDDDGNGAATTSAPSTTRPPDTTTTTFYDTSDTWESLLPMDLSSQLRMTEHDSFDVLTDPECILDGMRAEMDDTRLRDVYDEVSVFGGGSFESRVYLADVLTEDEWDLYIDAAGDCVTDFDQHVRDVFADQLLLVWEDEGEADFMPTEDDATCISDRVWDELGMYDMARLLFGNGDRELTSDEDDALLSAAWDCAGGDGPQAA